MPTRLVAYPFRWMAQRDEAAWLRATVGELAVRQGLVVPKGSRHGVQEGVYPRLDREARRLVKVQRTGGRVLRWGVFRAPLPRL